VWLVNLAKHHAEQRNFVEAANVRFVVIEHNVDLVVRISRYVYVTNE
jgi:ABC-type branched-subunit amino acid transport system ATPase component